MVRMVLVILLPIFALIALTVVVIVQAANTKDVAYESQDAVNTFLQIDNIVKALGVSRCLNDWALLRQ